MPVEIGYASEADVEFLHRNDDHVSQGVMRDKVARGEVIVARARERPAGWLRFGLAWDLVPFMTMLTVVEEERGKGIGTSIIDFWEREMRDRGYERVMTSTQADERAQHLYRRLGYRDCGSVLFPGQVPLEVFLIKSLA